ncbi:MAG: radical SAM protein [Planctomycetes bacterium]|nr:radical SAM protein [Planctomycetota bacterium]
MRRQYLALARRRLARPGWLWRGALRYLTIPRSTRRGRPLTGPLFASYVVNYHCNLACEFCGAWRSADGARQGQKLSPEQEEGLLDDLARLGTLGVGITGGEPLLREDIVQLVARIRQRGMVAHLNTNGTRLTLEMARALVAAGVASVNTSLDAPDAATHDRIRGRAGAFDQTIEGLRHLLEARKAPGRPRVTVVSVVQAGSDPEAMVALAEELGVDAIGFLPRHGFGSEVAASADAFDLQRRLVELKRRSPLVDSSKEYLGLFGDALQGHPHDIRCHVGASHLAVDLFGEVFACMPYNESGRSWASLHDAPLRELWAGTAHRRIIVETSKCRDCTWNCHTEVNLLFRGRGTQSDAC